jgi:hypothetical protein
MVDNHVAYFAAINGMVFRINPLSAMQLMND